MSNLEKIEAEVEEMLEAGQSVDSIADWVESQPGGNEYIAEMSEIIDALQAQSAS